MVLPAAGKRVGHKEIDTLGHGWAAELDEEDVSESHMPFEGDEGVERSCSD